MNILGSVLIKLLVKMENSDSHKLRDAITNADVGVATSMLKQNPGLLTEKFTSYCSCPDCGAQQRMTPLSILLQSEGNPKINRIPMIIEFFEKGILKAETFPDKELVKFVHKMEFTSYLTDMFDILIQYLQKEKWQKVRNDEGSNLLYTIASSCMKDEIVEHYFKVFVEMGLDPLFVPPFYYKYFPSCGYEPVPTVWILIEHIRPNLLRYVVDKFQPDPKHFNKLVTWEEDNAMMSVLHKYRKTKEQRTMWEIKELFEICVERGMDLNYQNKFGETIYDHIINYQWTDCLQVGHMPYTIARCAPRKKSVKRQLALNLYEEMSKTCAGTALEERKDSINKLQDFVAGKLKPAKYEKRPSQIYSLKREFMEAIKKVGKDSPGLMWHSLCQGLYDRGICAGFMELGMNLTLDQ